MSAIDPARYQKGKPPWEWPQWALDRLPPEARLAAEERAADWAFENDIRHLDGIPWHEAPLPRRWHVCWPQTDGWLRLTQVQRCACGAIRSNKFGPRWSERNSRRNER